MKYCVRSAVAGFLFFISMGVAQADETLETIVVAGMRAQNIAGKASLIDEHTVQAVRATHSAELLARVPGAWISRGGGQEHLTALRSPVWTGAGACGEVVFAEDGVPVRPSGFCNANQMMEINSEQAGGVEVLRGTQGGALYGANAVHGAINVLSLPLGNMEESTEEKSQRSSVSLEGGPNDYARTMWTQRMDDGYLAMQASHDGGFQDSAGYDQQKISWKQRQLLSDISLTHYVTATDLNQQSGGFLEGVDAYKNDRLKQNNSKPDAYRDAQALRYVQSWDWRADDYRYSIKPYVRHSEMEFSQHFSPGEPLEKNSHNSLGVQGSMLRDNFSWGTWQGGAAVETAEAWTHEWQVKPAVANSLPGEHYDYGVAMNTLALWQEVTRHMTDSLDVQAGMRADRIVYGYDNHLAANTAGKYTRPADRNDGFTVLSPRVGLVYTDSVANEWYASVSRGQRAPQTAELYRLQGGQSVTDISAVEMNAGELGWRGSNRWQTQWNVALFDMRKNHVIVRNVANVLNDDARTQHRGVEMNIQQDWNSGWFVSAAATYAEHRYNSDVFDKSSSVNGNIMDTAPRTFGSVQMGWQQQATRVELEWQHMGAYYLNPEDSFIYEGHELLHVRTQYAVNSQWKLFARLMNVTDMDYAERADVTVNNNPALVQPRYFVGAPRSLFLGFEWSY